MKKILVLVVCLLFFGFGNGIPTAEAQQNATPANQFEFTQDRIDGVAGVKITEYIGTGSVVVIPNQINGVPVRIIGDYAFEDTNVTSVTIPASVVSIGERAFDECASLTTVNFAQGSQLRTIDEQAFAGCAGLTNIIIPASVTSIGDEAFAGCSSLVTVSFVQGSQLRTIGDGAFTDCKSLTSITIPASVTSIGEGAFDGCINLVFTVTGNRIFSVINGGRGLVENGTLIAFPSASGSIILPSGLTSIGFGAFADTNLISITIPASIISIGDVVFLNCRSLTTVTILANRPPTWDGGQRVFGNTSPNLQIIVPANSINAYRTAPGWSRLANRIVGR